MLAVKSLCTLFSSELQVVDFEKRCQKNRKIKVEEKLLFVYNNKRSPVGDIEFLFVIFFGPSMRN